MKTITLEELEGWQIQECRYYLDAAAGDRPDGKSGVVKKYPAALTKPLLVKDEAHP
jgi:hypothetical protein